MTNWELETGICPWREGRTAVGQQFAAFNMNLQKLFVKLTEKAGMNNEEIRYGDTIRMCDFVQVYLGVYICVFAAISVISAIIYISTGDMEKIGTNGLELNSMIYVGILGVFGFKEDFKMLIQNGFTRKYIFLATLSLFAFTSAIMAAVDTIVGNALHAVASGYFSLFGGLYGYEHSFFLNWLWLFLAYMLVCCLLYLSILIINKIGKVASIYLAIGLGLTVVLIIRLC